MAGGCCRLKRVFWWHFDLPRNRFFACKCIKCALEQGKCSLSMFCHVLSIDSCIAAFPFLLGGSIVFVAWLAYSLTGCESLHSNATLTCWIVVFVLSLADGPKTDLKKKTDARRRACCCFVFCRYNMADALEVTILWNIELWSTKWRMSIKVLFIEYII